MTDFQGFPVAGLDFYDDLEVENTKEFWEANKAVYKEAVEAPMKALTGELAAEFGPAKVFRPYRDVRFAKDKTPYKTHQGAFVGVAPATGWYVELSARGVRTGAGFYEASSERMGQFRTAVDDERRGAELQQMLKELEDDGFEIGGETLKTAPRGFTTDHPRIELLRHKQLFAGRPLGFEPVIHSAELLDVVRADWQRLRPLVEWLTRL